jgi:hypothetical protein
MKITKNKKVKNGFILDVGKNGNIGFGYGPIEPPTVPLLVDVHRGRKVNSKGFVYCTPDEATEFTIRLRGWFEGEPYYSFVTERESMCEPMPLDFMIAEMKAYFKEV